MRFAAHVTAKHPLLKLALMSETRYVETELSQGMEGVSRHKTKTIVVILPSRPPPTSDSSPARNNPINHRLIKQSDLPLSYGTSQDVEEQYDIVDKRFPAARIVPKHTRPSPSALFYVILKCRAIRELSWTQLLRRNHSNRSGPYLQQLDNLLQPATALDSESDPQVSGSAPAGLMVLAVATRG